MRFLRVGLFHGGGTVGRLGRNGLGDATGVGWQGFIAEQKTKDDCSVGGRIRFLSIETTIQMKSQPLVNVGSSTCLHAYCHS